MIAGNIYFLHLIKRSIKKMIRHIKNLSIKELRDTFFSKCLNKAMLIL